MKKISLQQKTKDEVLKENIEMYRKVSVDYTSFHI